MIFKLLESTRVLIRVWMSLDELHESREIAGQQTRTGESATTCTYIRVCTQARNFSLLNVPKLSVFSNLHESIRVMENQRESTRVLEIRGKSHFLHSDLLKYIRVDRIIYYLFEYSSYSKSSPMFTNYKKLSDIIGFIRE